jgi:hypothetical protein
MEEEYPMKRGGVVCHSVTSKSISEMFYLYLAEFVFRTRRTHLYGEIFTRKKLIICEEVPKWLGEIETGQDWSKFSQLLLERKMLRLSSLEMGQSFSQVIWNIFCNCSQLKNMTLI